jgi:hypothetical protein
MSTTLIHTLNDAIELRYRDQSLFTYVYESKNPAVESPKPYFHPLRTLAGNEVSLFRPHDHLWHIGVSMSIANFSGENFWGGATYTREQQGYIQLDNNGRTQHVGWDQLASDGDTIQGVERLQWLTHDGQLWIDEERHIAVSEINAEAGYWTLDLSFKMLSSADHELVFGSPTTEGREQAGYGGLFWRGPRSFLYGQILAADGLEGPELMGKRAPWLAFIGKHDGNLDRSTLLFIDKPGNLRYPNKWFVRNDPYACVSFSFMFDEYYTLPPQETLEVSYRMVICNGAWSRAQIDEYVGAYLKSLA